MTPPPPTEPAPAAADPPTRRRSVATVVLAVLVVLLLAGLAGLTALYVTDQNRAEQQAADQNERIEKLERDLEGKNNEVNRVNDKLETADACIDAVREFFIALDKLDLKKINKTGLAVEKECEEYEIA
jgi:peptidoglycan hydrolase CwlO-like protein